MPLMPAKPEYPHDHAQCSSDALAEAQRICARRGVRLTETRQKVLELIWGDHAAVKAYDLLEQLSGPGRAVRPPTIYRALDFLLENGLIHRIESLNAYVGCPQPGGQHSSQFLICDACSIVIELTGTDVVHAVQMRPHHMALKLPAKPLKCMAFVVHVRPAMPKRRPCPSLYPPDGDCHFDPRPRR